MQEVLLLDLKVDQATANKALGSVLVNQEKLVDNTKQLVAEQKKLKQSGQENTEVYAQNAKQIVLNKEAISKNNAEIKAITKSMDAETDSIQDLVAQNKKLVEERNKVSTSTEEGRKKIDAINAKLDKNNEAIKANVSALEKQKMGVGDYTGALDKLVPGLGATTQGFLATAKSMWAVVSNPLGITLTALGVILAGLIKFLTGTARGQDELNKIMAIGGAVIGKVSDAFVWLIENGIKNVISGLKMMANVVDFLIPGFKDLLSMVGDELNQALGDPIALANLKNRNDVLERELVLLKDVTEAKIAELKLQAEDKSLDLVTRQEALKEAKRLLDELSAKQTEFAENKLKISQQEHSQSESTKEDLLEEAQLEAELARIKKDNADKSIEMFTKEQEFRTQLRLENAAADADEAARKRAESETQQAEEITIQTLHEERKVGIVKKFEKLTFDIRKKFAEDEQKVIEQKEIFERAAKEATFAAVSRITGQTKTLFKQGSEAYKITASTEAAINTRAAAIAAYKATAGIPVIGPVLAVIAAAAATAFGLKQIYAINQAKFAEGGEVKGFTLRGKDHSQGGTKFVGSDGTRFEAQRGEGLFVLKREAHQDLLNQLSEQNTRFGGVSLTHQRPIRHAAQGGEIAVANLSTNSEGANDIGRIVEAIQQLQVVVEVDEIANGLQRRAQVLERVTPIS